MLIITRRPGETFFIGEGADRVEVIILGVIGGQVRFGIEAPRHIVVDRAEIAERKKRARELAGGDPESEEEREERSGGGEQGGKGAGRGPTRA